MERSLLDQDQAAERAAAGAPSDRLPRAGGAPAKKGRGRERVPLAPVRILLVEDSPGEACLVSMALNEAGMRFELEVIEDGTRALQHLRALERGDGGEPPDLVLLDLKLPGTSGQEVLGCIRGSERLADMPVVVLTGSSSNQDKIESVALGANVYLSKPLQLQSFLKMGECIRDLWTTLLRPREAEHSA